MSRGIIALDIDGTLTEASRPIPKEVLHFLSELGISGWSLIFITGRTFNWAHRVLAPLQAPYVLAVQNGAALLQMPEQTLLLRNYLDNSVLPSLDEIFHSEPSDYIIYSGYEHGDRCFYRPERFEPEFLKQLLAIRVGKMHEEWVPVDNFSEVCHQGFASAKGFGLHDSALYLSTQIESILGLHAPMIRDILLGDVYIVQATKNDVDKGRALLHYAEMFAEKIPKIAAGDDLNDLSLFAAADFRIVMETAPIQVLAQADFVAPAASKNGIIVGLKQALKEIERGY